MPAQLFVQCDQGQWRSLVIDLLSVLRFAYVQYTMDANERSITVHLDAFMQLPPASNGAMRVSQPESLDLTPGSLWIVVGCQDSGKGLSSEELKKLFAKFSQANPR